MPILGEFYYNRLGKVQIWSDVSSELFGMAIVNIREKWSWGHHHKQFYVSKSWSQFSLVLEVRLHLKKLFRYKQVNCTAILVLTGKPRFAVTN